MRHRISIRQDYPAIPKSCRVSVVCLPMFPHPFPHWGALGETNPVLMSQNVLFCISSYSRRFNENLSIYGGCAHFCAYPHQIESDPFGVMRGLHEKTIYKRVNRVSWYCLGETFVNIPPRNAVNLTIYIIMFIRAW